MLADTRTSQITINSRIDDVFERLAANFKSSAEAAVSASSDVVDRTAEGSVHSSDVAGISDVVILGSVAQDGTSVATGLEPPGDVIAAVDINAVNNASANSVVSHVSVHSGRFHSQSQRSSARLKTG